MIKNYPSFFIFLHKINENSSKMTFSVKNILTTVAMLFCVNIASYAEVADTALLDLADFDDALWWQQFGDPLLDSLITVGLERNYDVAMAAKRVNIARNTLTQTRSAYYPTLGLNLGWDKERMSGNTSSQRGRATNMAYLDAGISLSWEIDLFGRI